jgi:DNA repair protein RadC
MEQLLSMVQEKALSYSVDRITNASDVYHALAEYSCKEQEHFMLITLDGASKIIEKRVIFIGTLNQSLVHPREVFRPAILDNAAGIIIAHNHPSGTLEASRADVQITKRLKEVSKLVGIELLDHVIISKNGYYSFSDEGML